MHILYNENVQLQIDLSHFLLKSQIAHVGKEFDWSLFEINAKEKDLKCQKEILLLMFHVLIIPFCEFIYQYVLVLLHVSMSHYVIGRVSKFGFSWWNLIFSQWGDSVNH